MPRTTWTEDELSFLRQNANRLSRQAISEAFNGRHTEAATRSKIVALGLSSRKTASQRMAEMNDKRDGNIGDEYDRLTVIGEKVLVRQGKHHCYQVRCRCKCENEVVVLLTNLRRRRTRSCGCLGEQLAGDRTRTHGMTNSRLYRTWAGMKSRCFNENDESYDRYGARGITVCQEWLRFEPFRDWALENGYADDLEIDRKESTGNYEPGNCRWSTIIAQANNRSNNRVESLWGQKKTLAEWSRDPRCVVSYDVMNDRLRLGWKLERAMTTQCRKVGELTEEEKGVRMRARWAVSYAVREGKLEKPSRCQHPGCDRTEIEGHHHLGYDPAHWLDVRWLCPAHHAEAEYE